MILVVPDPCDDIICKDANAICVDGECACAEGFENITTDDSDPVCSKSN